MKALFASWEKSNHRTFYLWVVLTQNSVFFGKEMRTRSSWLNCALRDDEAVYWVSIGHYEAVAVVN